MGNRSASPGWPRSALLFGLLLSACSSGSSPDGSSTAPRLTSIVVTLPSPLLTAGDAELATAVARDQAGAVMSGVTFTWASSSPGVATVSYGLVTGMAAGTASITASSAGVTSGAASLTIAARQDFQVMPPRMKLKVGGQAEVLAVAPPGAVTWSSSAPGVASVDASGQVTAISRGSATITATSGAASAVSAVKVFMTTGPAPDPSSEVLIAQALAMGTISAEQALEYRVFALFGSPRLPAAFDGAPGGGPDHMLMRQVMEALPTLSPTAQDLLLPFFLPPIYTQSALAPPPVVLQAAARPGAPPLAMAASLPVTGINCTVSTYPTAYRRVSVTTADGRFTFNVVYFPRGSVDAGQQALAELIASLALELYDTETALVATFPRSDGGLPCNGGDAGIDIYLTWNTNLKLAGQTIPYSGTCASTPSFIELNVSFRTFMVSMDKVVPEARSMQRGVVAHELLHVLQLAMTRNASCDDSRWFDEATSEWIMDHVEPKFPPNAIAYPGIEDGLERVWDQRRRTGEYLAEYLYRGHLRSLEKGEPLEFGYADYLFFQYLERTQTVLPIIGIFDNMAGGMKSVEALGAAVDMTAIWPEFAKTLWNDVTGHVLDYWQTEDGYDFGLADIFRDPGFMDGAPANLRPLEIDQLGQPEQVFTLLDVALERSTSGDYEIPPRSLIYEQLRFTDPTVHTAIFSNPIAGDPVAQYMKIWAVKKVGGAWQPPEDWTQEPIKAFCLDRKDERLEELLVIVSNSEVHPSTEKPYRIPIRAPMQVATTNVGCWRWQGTASLTTTTVDGPVTVESATVTFDQARSELAGLPDAGMSLGYVVLGTFTSSTATFDISGVYTASGCTVTGSATVDMQPRGTGGFVDTDGDIILTFGLPEPLHRAAVGSGTTTIPGVRETLDCPGGTEVLSIDQDVHWLSLPEASPRISPDGQHIGGIWSRTDADGDKVSTWDLHALREP